MKRLPLRLKIALLSMSISAVVLLGLGLLFGYLLYRQQLESLDTELRALGTRHPGWLANRANFERFNASLDFIFGEEHEGRIILLVKDGQGRVLYVSPGWPAGLSPEQLDCSLADDPHLSKAPTAIPVAPRGPPWAAGGGTGRGWGGGFGPGRGGGPVVFTKVPRFRTIDAGDSVWRLGLMGNDDLRLAVGLDYSAARAELNRARNVFLVAFPCALLLIGGGGWLVAGRAVRPLTTIAELAESVTAQGLDQRIAVSDAAPEITRLIHMLNGMMDRLEKSFRQATRFSADASHELKTPLSIMQAELEQALQAGNAGSPEQEVFAGLLEQTQRLKTITRSLLLLAQADAGQLKLAREPLDLSAETEALLEDAQALAADMRLNFNAHLQPELRVEADRALLHTAMLNLVTNAIKYNEPGGGIGLTLELQAGRIVLAVCNTGPGIPLAEQHRVFERFYRGDRGGSGPTEGIGLGLSLAREIVRAHGGELTLKESRPGRTCFELRMEQAG